MDERTSEYYGYSLLDRVRLAENKFVLIDKKLKQYHSYDASSCKASLRLLKAPKAMDPNQIVWYIRRVADHHDVVNSLLRSVDDMLRIATGHLKQVDESKKFLAKYSKLRGLR